MYATTNIIWSENDVARAADADVQIATENELQYFDSFVKHLGPAARYQILGDIFAGQRIPGMGTTKVPAIRSRIGGHKAYYFMTTPRVLLKLAFINHLALNHPDGRPAYQRMISSKRIKDIGEFIIGGGFFPTNLLVNFQSSPRFDLISNKENTHQSVKFGWLTLPALYRSAWIIDGQHRLYGFSKLDDRYLDSAISVIAFDQLNPHKEADLFITINHEQKSVPKSLLVTLLADLRLEDSHPKKRLAALCSAVVRALNSDPSSPLGRRFAVQGLAPEEGQDLTVSEAVNGLVWSGLLGRVTHDALAYGPLAGATDDATIERARVVLNGYFDALRQANEGRWETGRKAYVCVNPGIRAHLTLIGEAVRYLEARKGIYFADLKEDEFIALLRDLARPVFEFVGNATDEAVGAKFARKFGEGGVREYLYNLCAIVNKAHPNFGSDEFREYLAQKGSTRVQEAHKFVIEVTQLLNDHVIEVLKAVHGTQQTASGEQAFWEIGIGKRTVRDNAYKRQQDEPLDKRLPKEAYLELLDLKSIIEQKNNWLHFQNMYNLQMPDEQKGKARFTSWIAQLSEIRRIPAHKSSLRTYKESDFEFLDWLRGAYYEPVQSDRRRED